MTSKIKVLAAGLLCTTALFASGAHGASNDTSPIETVVVTGTAFKPESAPAKASLDTTQPQTIIQKDYIDDSIAPTADYVTLLSIVPSLSGLSINGPGLSDGNVKNTLRGMPDGNFGLSYDGIPFGDTNGPTHHSESYFPSSTIGSSDVDRGPGNAGTLSPNSYGGTIKLYSEGLTDSFGVRQTATYGDWNTFNFNTNVQTGAFDVMGLKTRVLVNYQSSGSSGYLTFQSTHRENELVKLETELSPDWTITVFGSRNGLSQLVSDKNGATAAQAASFGKDFALQNTDATLPTYAYYNPEHKETDMEYVRLHGNISSAVQFDDQAYTYAYVNKTVTTSKITQTQAEINANKGEGLGTKVGGVSYANDIGGYTKLNAYRVWGNIARVTWDYDFGAVTGEVRGGVWSEWQGTQRERFYLDITKCAAAGGGRCDGFGVEWSGLYADQKTSSGTKFRGINGVGYFEHTGWSQYEPFLELDIKPLENLTLTPGVKYIWWDHTIDPNSLITGKPPTIYGSTTLVPGGNPPNPTSFKTNRVLPFATVNYKVEKNWSVYAQYANGVYVPDISAFEVNSPIKTFPKPQTTTNYQFGTVYYADNFSVDGDVYYIDSANTIGQDSCDHVFAGGSANDTCNYNAGQVTYKGIEAEGTYVVDEGPLDGLSIFVNGSINSAKVHTVALNPNSPTVQDKAAPFWTAASGLIYKHNDWKISLIDKMTGQQYADSASSRLSDYVSGKAFYRLGAYNKMDLTAYYDLGDFTHSGVDVELGGGLYNLLNDRSIVSVSTGSGGLSGTSVQDFFNRPTSTDQYYFAPERSFQVTLKVRL